MSNNTVVEEPQGIAFFSIKTGETHYCKLEPTISAYINSSDMGINASRDQDYGWRLDAEWVKRVRAFKRDRTQMSILTQSNQGQKPTTVQILYFMYGEELANYFESMEENENPYEEAYLAAINSGANAKEAAVQAGMPQALADFQSLGEDDEDDMTDLIDDVMEEDNEELETPAEPTSEAPPADNDHVTEGAEKFPEAPKTETKPAKPSKK